MTPAEAVASIANATATRVERIHTAAGEMTRTFDGEEIVLTIIEESISSYWLDSDGEIDANDLAENIARNLGMVQ
jgi:hypothetical protein